MMKPRFNPQQQLWTPFNHKAECVEIMNILWGDYVTYKVMLFDEDYKQIVLDLEDVEHYKAPLFLTKEECEAHINSVPLKSRIFEALDNAISEMGQVDGDYFAEQLDAILKTEEKK